MSEQIRKLDQSIDQDSDIRIMIDPPATEQLQLKEGYLTPGVSFAVAEQSKTEGRLSEDRVGIVTGESCWAVVVVDGAGGSGNGGGASDIAVNEMINSLQDDLDTPPLPGVEPRDDGGDRVAGYASAKARLLDVNNTVYDGAEGGYTTMSILRVAIRESTGKMYAERMSVGDSPIMILRNGELVQLGVEETFAQSIIENFDKPLNEEDIAGIEDRYGNVITNALGHDHNDINLDERNYDRFELLKGDIVLMCSDGLTGDKPRQRPEINGLVGNDAVKYVLEQTGLAPLEKVELLKKIARKDDDFTAVVIEVGDWTGSDRASMESSVNSSSQESKNLASLGTDINLTRKLYLGLKEAGKIGQETGYSEYSMDVGGVPLAEIQLSDGSYEGLSGVVMTGRTLLGVRRTLEPDKRTVKKLDLVVLPIGHSGEYTNSPQVVMSLDKQTAETPNPQGVIQSWRQLNFGRDTVMNVSSGMDDMISRKHMKVTMEIKGNYASMRFLDDGSTNGTGFLTIDMLSDRTGRYMDGSSNLATELYDYLSANPESWSSS